MKNLTFLILLFFAGLLISSCGDSLVYPYPDEWNDKTPEEIKEELTDKNWQLRSIQRDGYSIYAPENDSMYTIRFADDGTIGANDVCNQCGGEYEITPSKQLMLESIFCTEAACNQFPQKMPFTSVLAGKELPFYMQDNYLYVSLKNDGESKLYVFADADEVPVKKVVMANPTNFDQANWLDGSFHHLEAEIINDTLSIDLGYSGCGPHDLNLVFYNYFMESYPVQAYAFIAHKNEGCRAVFRSQEKFDLTPLKKEYQTSYGKEGIISISIIRDGEAQETLQYSF